MAAVTTAALIGAGIGTQLGVGAGLSLGGSFLTAGLAGGAIAGYGTHESMGGFWNPLDELKPDIPEAPTPEAPTEVGEEGIRRGEMQRQSRRRELGALYLTRGQSRAPTLGEMKQTLG